ncbi:urate oxidase/2-oxo-4-hydroxy-4-carboxy-5-ureidoimidazoline decarboxylase [Paenibacillus sp. DS2015]|uniref:factor-independent urate hydroxylase n=1 Tax=Paenibacillus sp. DS2015 TaxID=3373917 RepID=UPI003D20A215
MKVTLEQVNCWNCSKFTEEFGGLFERSPWIAEQAWVKRPFLSLDHMFNVMKHLVLNWSAEQKLTLLRSHPDLGTRLSMSSDSKNEQISAGLDSLDASLFAELERLNQAYTSKFSFPFIMAVKGQSPESIASTMNIRLSQSYDLEFDAALQEVVKIASFRLETWRQNHEIEGGSTMKSSTLFERTMYYGKGDVWVYRSYAKPLTGVYAVPDSSFAGRPNILFGMNIKVAVKGEAFLTSFSKGDNTLIVATDSMKNFILRQAGHFEGATMEGFLEFASRRLLETYPQMTGVQMTADQVTFDSLPVVDGGGFVPSDLVFRYSQDEHATAAIEIVREGDEVCILNHFSGVADLKFIKVRGSSFAGFVRDEYTTLPETYDRPLFIFLSIGWRYEDALDGIDDVRGNYVDAQQVRDIAAALFHEQNSPSIQNLIYRIGLRILSSFPHLEEVWFESNNRTWETIVETIDDSEGRVFTEPRPPYGFQGFSMTRADLENAADQVSTGELLWQES